MSGVGTHRFRHTRGVNNMSCYNHDDPIFRPAFHKLMFFLRNNYNYRLRKGPMSCNTLGLFIFYYAEDEETGDIYNPLEEQFPFEGLQCL